MRRDGGSVFPARANTGDPKWPVRGLSGNEIARALISMMAGSTSALQSEAGYIDARPQIRQIDENLLRRTAGPYIRVKLRTARFEHNASVVPPKLTPLHEVNRAAAAK